MKRFLLWVAAGLVVIILVLAALPFLISVDTYRGAIERAAHDATGRTLTIKGPMRLTVFPAIGIAAQDVHFSNVAAGRAADMISVGALQISVSTLPLLVGDIRVSTIRLEKPVINLEVNAGGQGNWTLRQSAEAGQSKGLPQGLHLSGITIADGALHYSDATSGKTLALTNLDLHVDVGTMDQPASLDGQLTYAGQRLTVSGHITTPQSLSRGARTGLNLSLKGDLLNAGFDGAIAADRSLSGTLTADAPSARKLGAWLGKEMPAGGGLGRLSVKARVAHTTGQTDFTDLHLALDGMTVTGALSVETGGVRPRVTGQLVAGRMDLNPYMQQAGAKTDAQTPTPAQGWSKTPLAVDALRLFDADVTLNVQSLVIRKLTMGKTAAHVVLADGDLKANLNPVTLYGGTGQARIEMDAHGRVPQFSTDLSFADVSMASLLGDALGVNKIEGVGKLTLNVTADGASADAIMHALTGKGALTVANGRIRGVNLGMVARTVKTALNGDAVGGGASTDFTQMGGSFVLARGILTNRDFRLTGPVLSATGQGTIDIGDRKIDFTITPQADVAVANVSVPFRIRGPWSHPSYLPDLAGLATGVVKGLVTGGGQTGNGLLGALMGGNKSASPQKAPPKKESPAEGFLGGLLGR